MDEDRGDPQQWIEMDAFLQLVTQNLIDAEGHLM